jgi:hypothetical protein
MFQTVNHCMYIPCINLLLSVISSMETQLEAWSDTHMNTYIMLRSFQVFREPMPSTACVFNRS